LKALKNKARFTTLALMVVCAAGAFAPITAKAAAFTDEQKAELEVLFKDYIMNNPQVMIDSVEKYKVDQEAKSKETAQEALAGKKEYFAKKDLPMAGNPDGDVTIVEFFDFNCGYCHKAFEDVVKLLEEDKNVRIVFQEMPILSPASMMMARMAYAAHKQGKYFEMHSALMNHRGGQTEEILMGLAKDIGLDMEKFKADMDSQDALVSIQDTTKIANDLGIRGTPGFIIGDEIFPGYIGMDGLKNAVAKARADKAK